MELRTRFTVHRPKVLHLSAWQEALPADIPFIATASPGISLTVRAEGEESTPSIAGHLSKKMMIYKKSPLPFRGQKSGWFKEFQAMLENFQDCTTIVDVFGGSGLLAHWSRRLRPDARVVWNDYDHFSQRLRRIPETNSLLLKIRTILDAAGIEVKQKIPSQICDELKKTLREHYEKFGYLDCTTVSSLILFSGQYFKTFQEFEKNKDFWRRYNAYNPYPAPETYLTGLTVVREDWRTFFNNSDIDTDRTLFLLDPPYFFTDGYSYEGALTYQDQSDLLDFMGKRNYCYFTNSNSAVILHIKEFEGATRVAKKRSSVSYSQSEVDEFMIYRHKKMNGKEKELEAACTRYARERGWLSIKLENTGHTGIPDRLYLKDGRAVFVEFKTPGSGRLSLFQSHWLKRLEKEQFTAVVIRSEEEFKELVT
ncbi:MAG: VRR-NUC domain-containing protein [Firmicutes bacterium]|nr:VRR-NUC domain-containing protein [Bacillota bacterium]